MDIAFTCENCGRNLVVDEAGAGITIDCPECGKPVYVPTPASPTPADLPTRVVPKPAPPAPAAPARIAAKTTTHRTVTHASPVSLPSTQQKFSVHPSIEAGVHCLLILVILQFVGFGLTRQNLAWIHILIAADMPFVVAALLCAVYGMCIGHVRHGLLILAALSLILGGSYWIMFGSVVPPVLQPSGADIQRQMEEFQKQMQKMFK